MKISFDLDDVLFVPPETYETEPVPRFLPRRLFPERLRKGTPELIHTLQERGYDVWIYTSSHRTERYLRTLFRAYGIRFNGIVNAMRHEREVQRARKERLPQKLPNYYRIALHIDDEMVICSMGSQYGFRTYHLDAQDDDWKDKIIQRAGEIKKLNAIEQRRNQPG